MAWNPAPQGITPAQANAGFQLHGQSISPALARPPDNGIDEAVQQAIAAVTGVLEKKRRDQIANQLLAADNAPLANGQTAPDFGGGVEGYAATVALRKQLQQQAEDKQNADYKKYLMTPRPVSDVPSPTWRAGHDPSSPWYQPPPAKPASYDPVEMTEYRTKLDAYLKAQNRMDQQTQDLGLTPEQIASIDDKTRGGVTRGGKQLPGVTFKSTVALPATDYTNSFGEPVKPGSALTEADAANLAAQMKFPGAVVATGKAADGTEFTIPYNQYHSLLNRSRHPAIKPEAPKPVANAPTQSSSGSAQYPDGTRIKQGDVVYEFQNGVPVPVK